jgi:hypothetical protein
MTFRFRPRLWSATLGLLPVVVQAGEPSPAPGINCPAHFGYYSTQWRPFPPCPPEPTAPTLPPPAAKTLLHAPPAAPRDQFAQADRVPVSRPRPATVGTPVPSPPPIAPPPAEPRPPAPVVRSGRETGFATIGKPAAPEQPVRVAAAPTPPAPPPKASIAPVKHEATPRPATPNDDVIRPAWPVIVPTAGSR